MKLSVILMSILFELFLWIIFSLFNVIFWGFKFIVYSCFLASLALSLCLFFPPLPPLLNPCYLGTITTVKVIHGLRGQDYLFLLLMIFISCFDRKGLTWEMRGESSLIGSQLGGQEYVDRYLSLSFLLFDLSFLGNIFSILSIKVPVIFSHQILPCFEGWFLVSSLYTSNIYLQMWQGILSMVS